MRVHVWRKRECMCGGRGNACVEEEGVHVWRERKCMCGGRGSACVEGEEVHVWRERKCMCGGRGSACKPGYAYKPFSINAELTIVSMAFSEQYR